MFGSYHLWSGNHWQPISRDSKEDMGAHDSHSSEDDKVNSSKHLLDGLTNLQLHCSSDSSSSNDHVLKQYSRSLECEEKLVKLFDNTKTITAKEDLLHSLR